MDSIFEMIKVPPKGEGEDTAVCLGIRVMVGGRKSVCPFTGPFDNYQNLAGEIQALKEKLDGILMEAKDLLPEVPQGIGSEIGPDMSPEEMWSLLSRISDDESFLLSFNDLAEDKRKAVAEYVLTECNIFSGRASLFSSRYDQGSGSMK